MFKSILKEGLIVSIADYISFGTIFLATILINNYYSTDYLGAYTIVQTISQFVFLALFQPYSIILRRDLALDIDLFDEYISKIINLRVLLSTCILIICGILCFIQYENLILRLIFFQMMSKCVEFVNETYLTAYQATEKFEIYVIQKILIAIINIAVIIVICINRKPFEWIFFAPTIIYIISLIYNFLQNKPSLNAFFVVPSKSFVSYIALQSWPILLASIMSQLNARFGIILLSFFQPNKIVGIFSIGITLISIFTVFVNSIGMVLFPKMTQLSKNITKLKKEVNIATLWLFILGIVVFLLFILLSSTIFKYYNGLTSDAYLYIRIISISIIPIITIGAMRYLFTILNKQKEGLQAITLTTIFNMVIFILFSYLWDILGSCIAYILGNVSLLVIFKVRLNQMLNRLETKN